MAKRRNWTLALMFVLLGVLGRGGVKIAEDAAEQLHKNSPHALTAGTLKPDKILDLCGADQACRKTGAACAKDARCRIAALAGVDAEQLKPSQTFLDELKEKCGKEAACISRLAFGRRERLDKEARRKFLHDLTRCGQDRVCHDALFARRGQALSSRVKNLDALGQPIPGKNETTPANAPTEPSPDKTPKPAPE